MVGTRAGRATRFGGPEALGMLILSIGLCLLSRLDASTSVGSIAVMLLITGLGIGLFTSPNSSAILGAVLPQRRGVANGVLGTARTLGMVLGIGVAGAVYTTTLGLIGDPGADGSCGRPAPACWSRAGWRCSGP